MLQSEEFEISPYLVQTSFDVVVELVDQELPDLNKWPNKVYVRYFVRNICFNI